MTASSIPIWLLTIWFAPCWILMLLRAVRAWDVYFYERRMRAPSAMGTDCRLGAEQLR